MTALIVLVLACVGLVIAGTLLYAAFAILADIWPLVLAFFVALCLYHAIF